MWWILHPSSDAENFIAVDRGNAVLDVEWPESARNIVVSASFGEGPLTIRFAGLHRTFANCGLLS
jgi:hypothetical protein